MASRRRHPDHCADKPKNAPDAQTFASAWRTFARSNVEIPVGATSGPTWLQQVVRKANKNRCPNTQPTFCVYATASPFDKIANDRKTKSAPFSARLGCK